MVLYSSSNLSDNLQTELQDTLKQLADAVAVMAKFLPDEQACRSHRRPVQAGR
jgi:hypothetical protein